MAKSQRTVVGSTVAVVVVLAALCGGAIAQSSSGCTNVIISMSPCLNYISSPSSGCCTQLGSVVRSQPQCLCEVLTGGGSSLGLNINQTQALELPKACNVQTPPTTQCNGTPSGSGSGSNTVPSTGNGSSDATSTTLAAAPLLLSLLIAAYATVF